MIITPDFNTAVIDPFDNIKTVAFICDVKDGETKQPYFKDPRTIVCDIGRFSLPCTPFTLRRQKKLRAS